MKIFKRPTFRMNLIIWLITIVIVSTSFFFFIYYNLSENPLRNVVKDNLTNLAKNKTQFVDYWLNENLNIMASLAKSDAITSGNPQRMLSSIESYNKTHGSFAEIAYVTKNGRTMYDSIHNPSVDVSDRDYFFATKNKVEYISDKVISRTTGQPIIVVSYPVIKDNSFDGAVIGVINLSKLASLIGPSRSENINDTFIVNKSGDIIISANQPNIIADEVLQSHIPSLSAKVIKDYIDNAFKNGSTIVEYTNSRGQKVLAFYIPLPHKDWILVSELDISQNINTVKKSSIEAGIFTLLFITFMLIPIILYLSQKLTNPLITISKMASSLAEGNFDMRIDYASNNEVGILAKSFNTMSDKLEQTYIELNKKITDLNKQKEEINLKNLRLEQVVEVNKTILEQLEEKNHQLEQANKVKAEFLSTMSHEFRTPMNSIIGYTEMILDGNDGPINEEQQKDLNIILKSSENLLSIINNVLDLSKVEAGKMTYHYKKFDLVDEITTIIENIKIMAQSKNLEMIFDFPKSFPEVYSDPVKINNIVSNILSNAVKFTDLGYIKVSLSKEDETFIVISIEDTGIGIAPNDINNIFDEFKQIDGSSTRKYGGTGLGLAIAKALVDGLGGTINVTSTLGKGSLFTIKLPIVKSHEATSYTEKAEPSVQPELIVPKLEKGNIVVVTRNSNNYNSINDILSKYNFKSISTDYAKALETVKSTNPDCIFIDIDLPCANCSDGWITLSDLKQDKITAKIPKIVISTQGENCLSFVLGADDYLNRPFNEQDLLHCINRCMSQKNRGYILLIDDNKDNFNLVSRVFRKNTPYSVLMSNSFKDITNILESSNTPEMIILNTSLTSVKAFEVINTLDSLGLQTKVPVISIAQNDLNGLDHEYLRQHTKKILLKHEIRYSKLVAEVKKLLFKSNVL